MPTPTTTQKPYGVAAGIGALKWGIPAAIGVALAGAAITTITALGITPLVAAMGVGALVGGRIGYKASGGRMGEMWMGALIGGALPAMAASFIPTSLALSSTLSTGTTLAAAGIGALHGAVKEWQNPERQALRAGFSQEKALQAGLQYKAEQKQHRKDRLYAAAGTGIKTTASTLWTGIKLTLAAVAGLAVWNGVSTLATDLSAKQARQAASQPASTPAKNEKNEKAVKKHKKPASQAQQASAKGGKNMTTEQQTAKTPAWLKPKPTAVAQAERSQTPSASPTPVAANPTPRGWNMRGATTYAALKPPPQPQNVGYMLEKNNARNTAQALAKRPTLMAGRGGFSLTMG